MQAVEVDLTADAPVTDNTVTLCSNHDFLLVFECVVKDANMITWKLPPLINNNDGSFNLNDDLDPIIPREYNITFILITEENLSQLRVHTGDIIGSDAGDHLTVSCSATDLTNTETKKMTIRISG